MALLRTVCVIAVSKSWVGGTRCNCITWLRPWR